MLLSLTFRRNGVYPVEGMAAPAFFLLLIFLNCSHRREYQRLPQHFTSSSHSFFQNGHKRVFILVSLRHLEEFFHPPSESRIAGPFSHLAKSVMLEGLFPLLPSPPPPKSFSPRSDDHFLCLLLFVPLLRIMP